MTFYKKYVNIIIVTIILSTAEPLSRHAKKGELTMARIMETIENEQKARRQEEVKALNLKELKATFGENIPVDVMDFFASHSMPRLAYIIVQPYGRMMTLNGQVFGEADKGKVFAVLTEGKPFPVLNLYHPKISLARFVTYRTRLVQDAFKSFCKRNNLTNLELPNEVLTLIATVVKDSLESDEQPFIRFEGSLNRVLKIDGKRYSSNGEYAIAVHYLRDKEDAAQKRLTWTVFVPGIPYQELYANFLLYSFGKDGLSKEMAMSISEKLPNDVYIIRPRMLYVNARQYARDVVKYNAFHNGDTLNDILQPEVAVVKYYDHSRNDEVLIANIDDELPSAILVPSKDTGMDFLYIYIPSKMADKAIADVNGTKTPEASKPVDKPSKKSKYRNTHQRSEVAVAAK